MQTGEVQFRYSFFVNDSFTLAYELMTATSESMMVALLPNLEIIALNQSLEVVWKKSFFQELGSGVIHGFVSIDALSRDSFLITPYMKAPFLLKSDGSLGSNLPSIKVSAPPFMEEHMAYFVGQDQIQQVDMETYTIEKVYKYKKNYPIGGVLKVEQRLLISGTDGSLDVFDLTSEEKIWTYYTEAALKGSPIYLDHRAWLLNQRSQLFAFQAPFQRGRRKAIKP